MTSHGRTRKGTEEAVTASVESGLVLVLSALRYSCTRLTSYPVAGDSLVTSAHEVRGRLRARVGVRVRSRMSLPIAGLALAKPVAHEPNHLTRWRLGTSIPESRPVLGPSA